MTVGYNCDKYPLKIPVYPGFCNQLPEFGYITIYLSSFSWVLSTNVLLNFTFIPFQLVL